MHWGDTVKTGVKTLGPLVLGIDPLPDHAPDTLMGDLSRFLERYTSALLDGAEGKVAFVKFQSAYFEAWGSSGIASLATCIANARERGFAVILDAKRGDIGSTASAYARAYLEPRGSDLEVDCLTINPFLGPETMEPFVDCARHHGKGLFVLVKTSNTDSGWLQDQSTDRSSVSERVAEVVARWADPTLGDHGVAAVGAVVGATYPEQSRLLRDAMPRSVFLAPGLGAQGGDAAAISALATPTAPVLVSASRGIAAVKDRTISLATYVEIIRDRLDQFREALGRPAPTMATARPLNRSNRTVLNPMDGGLRPAQSKPDRELTSPAVLRCREPRARKPLRLPAANGSPTGMHKPGCVVPELVGQACAQGRAVAGTGDSSRSVGPNA